MAVVEFACVGAIATVRLNRPLGLNAITTEMDEALFRAWAEINRNPDIKVAILSAAGERAFCIGGEADRGVGAGRRIAVGGGLTGVGGPLVILDKPLIAAVQGYCVGAGFELALCADIIIAADTAQFGMPETRVGIMAECGVMHRAIRQMPHRVAVAMILTGDRIDADTALHHGLINEVVPAAMLAARAQSWAEKITAHTRNRRMID